MRWFLVDKFIEVRKGEYAKAVKNISLSEDHLHDHFPGYPLMPSSLIVESLAQTGGILAGYSSDFKRNVILAKVPRVQFLKRVRPGDQLVLEARLTELREEGSTVEVWGSVEGKKVVEGEILFAHFEGKSRGDTQQSDFVFTEELKSVLNLK